MTIKQSSVVVTKNTRIPFGRTYRGKRLCDCPSSYLNWVATNLWDTDLHEFAYIAKQLAAEREDDDTKIINLEEAADEFLRQHNVDPKKL